MTNDLVSVIIPCYNNENYVAEAITSALGQTHKNIEVIVINDGSTDNSDAEILRFGDRILHLHQSNAGACVARNNGLSHAKGNFIKFLDGDDILERDCVASQMIHAQKNDVVVFGDYAHLLPDGLQKPGVPHSKISEIQDGDKASLAIFLFYPVLISTTLYRRERLQEIGGFDPTILRSQEHDLHLRLYMNGLDFEYHPWICFQYRQHFSPSRISVIEKNSHYYHKFENFQKIVERLRQGPRSTEWETNKQLLGRLAWQIARSHQRRKKVREAHKFFGLAQDIGGPYIAQGTGSYKRFVRLFGPVWAEHASTLTYRFRSILKKKAQDK